MHTIHGTLQRLRQPDSMLTTKPSSISVARPITRPWTNFQRHVIRNFSISSDWPTFNKALTELDNIDLPDASVNCVISLAGLHHLPDRPTFFRETFRTLKTGGSFCVADVKTNTQAAEFLNVFVDHWNSMGHKGDFFGSDVPSELESAGFRVVDHYLKKYHWHFLSVEDMCRYITLLFGLDLAQPEDVLKGIEEHLGYQTVDGACRMNWGLLFMEAIK